VGDRQPNDASTDNEHSIIMGRRHSIHGTRYAARVHCQRSHSRMAFGIGILGAGAIARVHAQGIADAGGQVVGFCDLDQAKAADAAASFDATAWTDRDQMFDCESVSAIVVAVPNVLHAPLAIAALDAGLDVLLEKPMAMSAAECLDVIAARDRAGRVLQVGFVCRFAATVLAARRHIEAGRLGEIYHAKAVMLRRQGIPGLGRWFTDRQKSGGGVLIDLGPHLVDLVLHLCDRPEVRRVSASTSSRFGKPPHGYRFTDMWSGPPNLDGTFDVDDGATAMLRCSDGLTISLETSWASHLPDGTIGDGVTLFGEQGAMHFDIWGNTVLVGTQVDGETIDMTHPIASTEGWGTAFQRAHETFRSNCGGGGGGPTGEEGMAVQAVLDAMYRSAGACEEVAVSS
jgi:predicted dehydrogenase